MSRLRFLNKFYRGPVFKAWLARLWARSVVPGAELVEMLGSPHDGKPGMTDNVYAAEQWLRAAETAGYIERQALEPSLSQRVMGAGGLSYRQAIKAGGDYVSPTFYAWSLGPKAPRKKIAKINPIP